MKYTNKENVSLPMAVWLAQDNYDYQSDENVISVTTLLRPTREIILSSRIPAGDGETDVAQVLSSRIGTAIHDAVERAWLADPKKALTALGYPSAVVNAIRVNPESVDEDDIPVYLEQRSDRKMGKWVISGKYDMIFDGTINDIKSTKTYTYTARTNDQKYSEQLSIYRWLNPDKITDDTGKIQFLFTNWEKNYTLSDPSYPRLPILEYPVKLMSLPQTENFIRSKLQNIELHWRDVQSELPRCTREELWQKPPTFKYFSKLDAKRATKTFDNEAEAYGMQMMKGTGFVKKFENEPVKCRFCNAASICDQAKEYVNQGILIL